MEFIAITGMHRSGTSLVARIVNLLGADIGPDDELMPPKGDNPSGFWEKLSVTRLNDEIFAAMGGRWSDPPHLPEGWHAAKRFDRFRSTADEIVTEGFTGEVRMFKDPRASLVLPFWKDVAPITRTVVCTRAPGAVAASLARRNRIGEERAGRLFVRYQVDAYLDGVDPIVVPFEALVADPVGWTELLAGELGLDPPDSAIEAAVSEYVDPGLIHVSSSGAPAEALAEAAEVDGLLRSADRPEARSALRAIGARLRVEGELGAERSRHRATRVERDTVRGHRDELLTDRDVLMEAQEETQQHLARTARERDAALEDRDRAVALRDEVEERLAETARQRDALIEDRDRAVALRDEVEERLAETARQRDELIEDRDSALARHDEMVRLHAEVMAERDRLHESLHESEEARARLGARLEASREDLKATKARLQKFRERYHRSLRGRAARLWRRVRGGGS